MGAERPPLASVDAVREELRRLGYLDSSLDRFVLTGASGATPLARRFARRRASGSWAGCCSAWLRRSRRRASTVGCSPSRATS